MLRTAITPPVWRGESAFCLVYEPRLITLGVCTACGTKVALGIPAGVTGAASARPRRRRLQTIHPMPSTMTAITTRLTMVSPSVVVPLYPDALRRRQDGMACCFD